MTYEGALRYKLSPRTKYKSDFTHIGEASLIQCFTPAYSNSFIVQNFRRVINIINEFIAYTNGN